MSPRAAPPSVRLQGLDALRALCMFLVVLAHAAVSFITDLDGFHARELHPHVAADWTMDLVRGFSMELFFLLSGYFACGQYARGGTALLVRERALRIGVPLAVAVPLLCLADWALRALARARGVAPPTLVEGLRIAPMHLWFLYYLLLATALWVLAVEGARRLPARLVDGFTALLGRVLAGGWAGAGLLAVGLVTFGLGPRSQYFDFRPVPLWLFYFGGYFALGWHLRRHPAALARVSRRPGLALALAFAAFLVWHLASPLGWQGVPPLARRAFVACLLVAYAWGMVRGLLGLALAWGARPLSRPVRYGADAAYWVYLAHWPVVTLAQVLLADRDAPGALKFALYLALGLGVSLVTYHAWVRGRALGRFLDGQPRAPAAPVLSPAPAVAP